MTHVSEESARSVAPVFTPWLAFVWVPNPGANDDREGCDVIRGWPTGSLGVSWLTSELPTLSDFEQRFIVTAAESPHSMLLVEAIMSGWCVVVRDLLTSRRFRVIDPEISQHARPEDILFSAVVTFDRVSTFLGPATHTVPSDWRVELRELRRVHWDARRDYSDDPWLTRAELMELMPELCNQYREAFDRERVFEIDTGGDTPEWTLLRWTVTAPFGAAFEGLHSLSLRDADREGTELETGSDGGPYAGITWYRRSTSANSDWKMIGFLHLEEGRLTADVPTRALADRLVEEVAMRLGAAATLIERRPTTQVRVLTAGHEYSASQWQNSAHARTLLERLARPMGRWLRS